MAGITDSPFRSLLRELGCGIVTTELISATGLKHNSARTKRLAEFNTDQTPMGIQLFGSDIDDMTEASQMMEQTGCQFIDLNFGCPVKKVVIKGGGAAWLKNPIELKKLFRSIKKRIDIPLTAKIRTGWCEATKNAEEIAQIAYDEGLEWLTIHGRTRAQGYAGHADWDYIQKVTQSTPLPIIGSGDVVTASQALTKLNDQKANAIMIGRGCLKNPWIFLESLKKLSTSPINKNTEEKKASAPENIFSKDTQLKDETQKNFSLLFKRLQYHFEPYEPRIRMLQIKKLSSWYSSGYRDSSSFRKKLFQIQDEQELLDTVHTFFLERQNEEQEDTSHEAFLRGGHG